MSLTLDNRKYSLEELQIKFGQSQGIWLYDICRGIDTSEGKMAPRRHSLYMQYLIKVKKKSHTGENCKINDGVQGVLTAFTVASRC
jgi:nucleotidyltransferase/DNA polymerase involved in DNA repair